MTKKWKPENFELEMNTVWSFPERGNWATHDAKYRGNWSPYIPRNLLLRYSKKGDRVLDQFAGGGTTLVEAKLFKRDILGVDIKPCSSSKMCVKKIRRLINEGYLYILDADSGIIKVVPKEQSVAFVQTSTTRIQN